MQIIQTIELCKSRCKTIVEMNISDIRLLFGKKEKTLFSSFLRELGVEHTRHYSDKAFNTHPYRDTLYGISKLLSDYGIKNKGYRITKNRELVINQIAPPYILQLGNEFLICYRREAGLFNCWREGRSIKIPEDVLFSMWTGIILLAYPKKNSIEPMLASHKKEELMRLLVRILFVISLLIFIFYLIFHIEPWFILPMALNIMGCVISFLIIQKEKDNSNSVIDSICSLFKHSDCNKALSSSASKLFGLVRWSEIGFGFFFGNLLFCLLFKQAYIFCYIVNAIALPYTIWSLWYQKNKLHTWCPLCLIVQIIVWLLFIVNRQAVNHCFYRFDPIGDILLTGCVYSLAISLSHLLFSGLVNKDRVEEIKQKMDSIRLREDCFNAVMHHQPKHEVSTNDSLILFGNNLSSNVITIVTNPHCDPCSKLNERINKLEAINNKFCLQYLFSSFGESFDKSGLFLIAIYFQSDKQTREYVYSEWYKWGRNDRETFFSKYYSYIIDEEVIKEYKKHQLWCARNNIVASPVILINGTILPSIYRVEDLQFFFNE